MPKYQDLLPDKNKKTSSVNDGDMTYESMLNHQNELAASPATSSSFSFEGWLSDMRRQREAEALRKYAATEAGLNDSYAEALRLSDTTRQQAIADANNAAALRRSTYGVQGEQLGRNGLALSGYSDYADQVNYATQRATIAQAQSTDAQNRSQAGLSYREGLRSAQDARDTEFANAQMDYTNNMVQYTMQQQAAQQQSDKAFIEEFNADPSAYSIEQIDALVNNGTISSNAGNAAKDYKARLDQAQQNYVARFDEVIKNIGAYADSDETISSIMNAAEEDYNAGRLSAENYMALNGKLASYKAGASDQYNYKDIIASMQEMVTNGELTAADYAQALNTMKNKYTVAKEKATWAGTMSGNSNVTVKGMKSSVSPKGIGNEMNEMLNFLVGTDVGTIAYDNKTSRVYVRTAKGWYELDDQKVRDIIKGKASK